MSIHKGHRGRMREEVLKGGYPTFNDLRSLEYLLFYTRARGDVNPVAHALLDEFGSLARVLDADVDALKKVSGVGENTAVYIKVIRSLSEKYMASRVRVDVLLRNTREVYRQFSPYFEGATEKKTFLAAMDSKHKLLGIKAIDFDEKKEDGISLRAVVDATITLHATKVIIAQNHFGDDREPSETVLEETEYIKNYLKHLSVTLVDRVMLLEDGILSFHDQALI